MFFINSKFFSKAFINGWPILNNMFIHFLKNKIK